MQIRPLDKTLIADLEELMQLGEPYVRPRTASDYWLYAELFASTCPVAIEGDRVVGAVIAMRNQDRPSDVYVQDVMTHPEWRGRNVATALMGVVIDRATEWGCSRLYLTSEPDNTAAGATWQRLGFRNVPGDREVAGVSVISDFKGPGKHRAVYQLLVT